MDETRTAWAAGLFEGEGSIYVRRTPPFYVQLMIVSTDRDVLTRFAGVARAGNVRLAVKATATHKAQYRWHTARRDEVARILAGLRPWFGQRRAARCDEALAWLADLRGLVNCGDERCPGHRTDSEAC